MIRAHPVLLIYFCLSNSRQKFPGARSKSLRELFIAFPDTSGESSAIRRARNIDFAVRARTTRIVKRDRAVKRPAERSC